jgi:hypothetical protein
VQKTQFVVLSGIIVGFYLYILSYKSVACCSLYECINWIGSFSEMQLAVE